MTNKPVGPVGWSLRIAAPVSLFYNQALTTDMLNHTENSFWRLDHSISLHRSYSLNIFLILWPLSTKFWNVVEFVWYSELNFMEQWVRMWPYSVLHCGKKRRKRMYRLPFTPCGFSSYTYNPPDETWFATIKAVFIFEEIVKKYQLKPLPPSQQQQQQQKTVKWVKNSTDLANSSYQRKKEIIRKVDWWSNMQCQTAFFFFFFLMSSYSLLYPFFLCR